MNVVELLKLRAAVLAATREFFSSRGFLEVETPVLYPGRELAPNINDFLTEYRDGRRRLPLSLLASPEVYLKRLLAEGAERIFQIGKFFRNGEISARHNPEFTGLEWYAAGLDYTGVMDLTTAWLQELALRIKGCLRFDYRGREIDLGNPWQRLTVAGAFRLYAGVEIRGCVSRADLAQRLTAAGQQVGPDDDFDDLFHRVYVDRVEPHLGVESPTWLYDYPAPLGALAKLKDGDPAVAERAELFIANLELANGYSELTDRQEQEARFLAWQTRKLAAGTAYPLDQQFLAALDRLPPKIGGIAIGLDRVLMLFAGAESIEQVLSFPAVREFPQQNGPAE